MRTYEKSQLSQLPLLNIVKLTEYSEDIEECDPKHLASIEVEKQRKKWDDLIAKYKSEVDSTSQYLNADQASRENLQTSKTPGGGQRTKTNKLVSNSPQNFSQSSRVYEEIDAVIIIHTGER